MSKRKSNPHFDRDLNLRDRILTALHYRGALPIHEISRCSGGTEKDLDSMLRKLTEEGAIAKVGRYPVRYTLTNAYNKTA